MTKRGRKGQLTIFIIIAILIIAIVLFIFLFWPKMSTTTSETRNPYAFMETCIGNHIEETMETVVSNGGTYNLDEDASFFFEGEYIRFLCHTNTYYERTCYRQVAFLLESIQTQIQENIEYEVDRCFDELEESYKEEGYTVNVRTVGDFGVRILPTGISINLGKDLTLTKGDIVEEYRNFALREMSELYEIIEVAENILLIEQETGDSNPEAYFHSYPDIEIDREMRDNSDHDDVKLYTITHRDTEERFRFAVRSYAIPPVPEGF